MQDKFQSDTVDVHAPQLIATTLIVCCNCTNILLEHYAAYDVSNVQDKFRSCTVDVQRSTLHCNNPKPTLLYVYKHILFGPICSM